MEAAKALEWVDVFGAIVVVVLMPILKQFVPLLLAKAKGGQHEQLLKAVERASDVVRPVYVMELQEQLTQALSPDSEGGSEITARERAKAMKHARERAWQALKGEGVAKAAAAYYGSEEAAVDQVVAKGMEKDAGGVAKDKPSIKFKA